MLYVHDINAVLMFHCLICSLIARVATREYYFNSDYYAAVLLVKFSLNLKWFRQERLMVCVFVKKLHFQATDRSGLSN